MLPRCRSLAGLSAFVCKVWFADAKRGFVNDTAKRNLCLHPRRRRHDRALRAADHKPPRALRIFGALRGVHRYCLYPHESTSIAVAVPSAVVVTVMGVLTALAGMHGEKLRENVLPAADDDIW